MVKYFFPLGKRVCGSFVPRMRIDVVRAAVAPLLVLLVSEASLVRSLTSALAAPCDALQRYGWKRGAIAPGTSTLVGECASREDSAALHSGIGQEHLLRLRGGAGLGSREVKVKAVKKKAFQGKAKEKLAGGGGEDGGEKLSRKEQRAAKVRFLVSSASTLGSTSFRPCLTLWPGPRALSEL